jgi:hypothetical protein
LYGADDHYRSSSINWQTYRLIHEHNQIALPNQIIQDFDALDGIDTDVVQIILEENAFDGQHAVTATSLALPMGFVVYTALCHASQQTRFEPISMALAASTGFKLLEAGGGAIATLIAGGGIYWGLKKFFTSDLKHKFAALERKVKESEAAYQLGLKTHKAQIQAEIADIKQAIKDIGQTHSKVMGNVVLQQEILKKLLIANPSNKALEALIESNEQTGQALQTMEKMTPETLRHKNHKNPFRLIWSKIHPYGTH